MNVRKDKQKALPVVATDSNDADQSPKFVRRTKRTSPLSKLPPKKAGVYRVIHGRIAIALPKEMWTLPSGEVDERKPRMEMAQEGDELEFSAADATRLFAANMLEELTANPSQCGRGHKIPKPSGPAAAPGTPLEYPAPVAG